MQNDQEASPSTVIHVKDDAKMDKGIKLWGGITAHHPDIRKADEEAEKADTETHDYDSTIKIYWKIISEIRAVRAMHCFDAVAKKEKIISIDFYSSESLQSQFKKTVAYIKSEALKSMDAKEFKRDVLNLANAFNLNAAGSISEEELLMLFLELRGRIFGIISFYYINKNDLPSAKRYLEKGLRVFPLLPAIFINLALIDVNYGAYAAAKDNYQKALIISQEFKESRSIANLYMNLGELHMLLADLENTKRFAVEPESKESKDSKDLVEAKKYIDDASKEYKQLTASDSLRPVYKREVILSALNNEGNFYRINKRYKEAIETYSKWMEQDKENTSAYYLRGIAYGFNRDFDNALTDFRMAIEKGLSSPLVYLQYVQILKNYVAFLVDNNAVGGDRQTARRLSKLPILEKIPYKEIEKIYKFILEIVYDNYLLTTSNRLIIDAIENLLLSIVTSYPPFKDQLIENLKNKLKTPYGFTPSQMDCIKSFLVRKLKVDPTSIAKIEEGLYSVLHPVEASRETRATRKDWCFFLANFMLSGGALVIAILAYIANKNDHSSQNASSIRDSTTFFSASPIGLSSDFAASLASNLTLS